MSTFKKMLKFTRPYLGQQILALFCSILEVVAFLIFPYIVKMLIDEALLKKDFILFPKVIFYYVSLVVGIVFFEFLKAMIYKTLNEKVVRDSRLHLYKHLRKIEVNNLDNYNTGTIMSYFNNDVPQMTSILTSSIVELAQNIIRIAVAIFVLGIINIKILIFILLLLPAYLLTVFIFNKPIRNSAREIQEQNALISDALQENLSGTYEIVSFNRKDWDIKRVGDAFSKYIQYAVKNTLWVTASNETGILIYWLAQILIYFIGGRYVMDDAMTIGTLLLYIQYMDNIYMPARSLLSFNNDIQQAIASGERYFDLIKNTSANMEHSSKGHNPLTTFKDRIAFDNVFFQYGTEPILKNLNFEIKKGETIAIVGASGAGKTTLIKLMLYLYKPTQGKISIDSHDIETLSVDSLYDSISVVFQDPFLFSDTVLNNIRFSKPDATREEVIKAAKLAGADSFIQAMGNEYDTELGERGSRLSGGQRQRIAIARGILKDASIFIFDEATSSLDSENQNLIYETIERLKEDGKTVISITHNLLNAKNMDRIIVLQDGKIDAIGDHGELIKNSNVYKYLYDGNVAIG